MKTLKKTYTAPKTELIKMEPVLMRFISGVRVDNNKVGDVVTKVSNPSTHGTGEWAKESPMAPADVGARATDAPFRRLNVRLSTLGLEVAHFCFSMKQNLRQSVPIVKKREKLFLQPQQIPANG